MCAFACAFYVLWLFLGLTERALRVHSGISNFRTVWIGYHNLDHIMSGNCLGVDSLAVMLTMIFPR